MLDPLNVAISRHHSNTARASPRSPSCSLACAHGVVNGSAAMRTGVNSNLLLQHLQARAADVLHTVFHHHARLGVGSNIVVDGRVLV